MPDTDPTPIVVAFLTERVILTLENEAEFYHFWCDRAVAMTVAQIVMMLKHGAGSAPHPLRSVSSARTYDAALARGMAEAPRIAFELIDWYAIARTIKSWTEEDDDAE